jgi:hypothetical protein
MRVQEHCLRLGSWLFPSGNTCEAVLRIEAGRFDVWFAWDDPPPLSAEDEEFYLRVVIPDLVDRARGFARVVDAAR